MVEPTHGQRQILQHSELDLLIVAPAGCGKTEALALRVHGLLIRNVIKQPRRILVTTFSNRARDNIRDRLSAYIPPTTLRSYVTISNFHGLSARIFRAHAAAIGLDPTMMLPDGDWIGEQCRSRGLNYKLSASIQDLLRRVKQAGGDDAAVKEHLLASGDTDALDIERTRVAENRLTYDDLPRVAELILANEGIADLYRNHFAAIMVDEFQDLTPQQLRIVNRIGKGKTTYAGDLTQGIYSFAGAEPDTIDALVRAECSSIVEFAESHRSSPAVINMVNSLSSFTGGNSLTSARPDSWPQGGLAGRAEFDTADDEAKWAVRFSRFVLNSAPKHRIGIIARTTSRRRFVDDAMQQSQLPYHRWDDGVLDTETAQIIRATLSRLDIASFRCAADPMTYLRQLANLDGVQDPSTREALGCALNWCCDLLEEGLDAAAVRARIRVGDETTLLNISGVHLLTGHVGKGQQFDWVLVVGAEDGSIPDFRATSERGLQEEARILSVMLSRARHGAVLMHARNVPAASTGTVYRKKHSRYWDALDGSCLDSAGVVAWLKAAPWDQIQAR